MAPRIPSNYGHTVNNQTKHCETCLILTLLTVTAQTSAHTETAADQDHSGVSITSKTGNIFFLNMKAATIAPETNAFPANRNGRRKKKKRHLLLGFRCCWSE